MKDIKFLLWLFPLLFMVHDFEEIIFIKPWIARNKNRLIINYPKTKKTLLHYESLSTQSFALGVLEEYILINIVTIAAYFTQWYYLWIGAFLAFTFHLIIHITHAIMIKSYIPSFATSVIFIPFCFYILAVFFKLPIIQLKYVILFSILGIVIMVVNLYYAHRGMKRFDEWLRQYQKQLSNG